MLFPHASEDSHQILMSVHSQVKNTYLHLNFEWSWSFFICWWTYPTSRTLENTTEFFPAFIQYSGRWLLVWLTSFTSFISQTFTEHSLCWTTERQVKSPFPAMRSSQSKDSQASSLHPACRAARRQACALGEGSEVARQTRGEPGRKGGASAASWAVGGSAATWTKVRVKSIERSREAFRVKGIRYTKTW